MRALVTGATGFIGSHLVDLLLSKNYQVRVLLRKTSNIEWLRDLPGEFVYGDIFDTEALRKAVTAVDHVYHSAGLTKAKTPDEYMQANAEGTKNLLEAVKTHDTNIARFVQISSQTVIGPSPGEDPVDESAEPRPITTYGKSKWKAEQECHRYQGSFPVTILRLPAVFGPRDRDIFEFFNTVNKGLQPMVGFSEKYISLIHARDAVRGIVMAAEAPIAAGETYFLTSSRYYGWKEIGDLTSKIMGKRVIRLRIPEWGVYVIAGVAEVLAKFSSKPALINLEKARDMVQDYWTCDPRKALKDFGFRQEISIEEGIQDTVDWYRRMRWL
jgi:nucleoside-diphosphate-sugar epimerase